MNLFKKYWYLIPIPDLINQNLQKTLGIEEGKLFMHIFQGPHRWFWFIFPMERFGASYRVLNILSPKTHVLATISVGGALSTCQFSCLAGMNSKSFQEIRSRSRMQFLFTTPILKADSRTYLSKQFVSEVTHMLKWCWGDEVDKTVPSLLSHKCNHRSKSSSMPTS